VSCRGFVTPRRATAMVLSAPLGLLVACASLSGLSGVDAGDGCPNPCKEGDASTRDHGDTHAEASAHHDVASKDARSDTVAPSEGSHADAGAPNLLTNGDFELGCAGWTPSFGTVSESSVAHTGAGSCEFCMGTNWEAFFDQTVTMPVGANETYFAAIWSRGASSPLALEDAGLVGEELLLETQGPDESTASNMLVPADWARVTSILKTTVDAGSITVEFRLQQQGNPAETGGVICVLLDDAVVQRVH
jgi:hypothetical protein